LLIIYYEGDRQKEKKIIKMMKMNKKNKETLSKKKNLMAEKKMPKGSKKPPNRYQLNCYSDQRVKKKHNI
jgi:hypothetical protein